ncbi:MAG TPA: RDD family protein [Candidatus Aquilonibacter sp.]|nr:RDD family protein [Candidatus Aquilonibacter sp.]
MHCGKCGAELAGSADKCDRCGEPVSSSEPPIEPGRAPVKPTKHPIAYAGFWRRAVAFIVDSLILGFLTLPILIKPILSNVGPDLTAKNYVDFMTGSSRQAIALQLLMNLILVLYCAAFESSAWQATPGKKLLRLYVTDLNGNRLSFARAAARNIGKVLEQFTLFIGFMMAGFTARKQALHDIVAGCLVLRKT